MAFARDVADEAIFMDGGRIVEQGAARQVIEDPQNERTRRFLARYARPAARTDALVSMPAAWYDGTKNNQRTGGSRNGKLS